MHGGVLCMGGISFGHRDASGCYLRSDVEYLVLDLIRGHGVEEN
jgi:hypothetical protein